MSDGQKLLDAAKCGDVETVDSLRRSGVDIIGTRSSQGVSCILLACINGHTDLLDYLLKHGADPNDVEFYGGTCLMAASCYRNPDCVRRLIEVGADVDYRYTGDNATIVYMTALCFSKDAEKEGEDFFEEGSVIRTVKLLLDAGASGNTPSYPGEYEGDSRTALQLLIGMSVAEGKVRRERDGLIMLLQDEDTVIVTE